MKKGFTLIEMLVTIAIFAAVFSVLTEGLYSGIRAWRSVRHHQVREAQLRILSEKVGSDFRHIVAMPEAPAIIETSQHSGGEKITIVACVPRQRQRAGLGWVWNRIEYAVSAGQGEGMVLRRTVQAYAGARPVGRKPEEETVLDGVKSVQFDYLGPDGESAAWTSNDSLPLAVFVTVRPETGGEFTIPAWVPGGGLKRSGVGF